ncbi:flagellar filament capping protein FliD [Stutzerimonas urumqiensis]|uniref:flagellar filament capping protein FliD n=1 Tax=Stutzerimonas urumqiensis TaxID=638269 RepID=UPI003BA9DCBA
MAIDSDYIKNMATQLANFGVQASLDRLNRNEANYQAQRDALSSLRTALSTFKTSLGGLKSGGSSMLVNSATFGQEGYATASVGSTAQPGTYQFFVEQLASAHQLAVNGLTDADVGNSGTLTIGQAGSSFTVDLASIDADGNGSNSLDELAAAINGHSGNTGARATLVRTDGAVSLVISSEKTGAANALTLSTGGTGTALANAVASRQELAAAQNAKVRLGGETGMLLENASNTFANLVEGVSLTFSKTHAAGEQPLSVTIGQDKTATKAKAQSFIDAFNTLMGTFDTLTGSGSDSAKRGALAGDSSVRSIEAQLNALVRNGFGGKSLIEYGISADRNGKLTIDATRFEAAVAADPEGFEALFTGKDTLLDTVDKTLATYTSSASGVLKNRMDSLDLNLGRIDEQFDQLQRQYDTYYTRYLRQFTSMMQTMQAMEQTSGLFTSFGTTTA